MSRRQAPARLSSCWFDLPAERRRPAVGGRPGASAFLSICHAVMGLAPFWAGRWGDTEAGVALAEEMAAGWRVWARSLGAIVAVERGAAAAGRPWLRAADGPRRR